MKSNSTIDDKISQKVALKLVQKSSSQIALTISAELHFCKIYKSLK